MAPMKLYGNAMSTCTGRVLAACEEVGAAGDVELVSVNFATGEHKKPPHIHRNPFGQVPALEDGHLMLFESRAITKYIARKYKGKGTDLLRLHNEKEAALVEVWMEVESHEYNAAVAPLIFQLVFLPMYGGKTDEAAVARYVDQLNKVLDVYEDRLSHSKYLAGDFFSMADLHHLTYTYMLMATPHANLINSRPHVKAWWHSIISRPSCKKITDNMAAASKQ